MITIHLVISSSIGLFLLSHIHLSPVLFPFVVDPEEFPTLPTDFCTLTPRLGHTGSIKLVEDCENLDMFPILPIPGHTNRKLGIHPIVCCPSVNKNDICFPTDPWCPNYVKPPTPAYNEDYITDFYKDYPDYELVTDPTILIDNNLPKVSDDDCSSYALIWGYGTRCVNLKDCPGIFGPHISPTSIPPNNNPVFATFCGWDNEDKADKVCCPGSFIQTSNFRVEVAPRFPGYKCQDKVSKCQQWKDNNGCRTDMDFVVDPEEPDNGRVNSKTMFEFMTGTCMETCELCGDKGCRDEHQYCPDWARQGYCVSNSDLMVHTCRESCGVCGFLSADEKRIQEVEGNTYSDFRDSNFDCGRYRQYTGLKHPTVEHQLTQDQDEEKDDNLEEDYDSYILRRNKRVTSGSLVTVNTIVSALSIVIPSAKIGTSPPGISANFGIEESGIKFCGATLVTDKWMITAAHCLADFGSTVGTPKQVKISTIRDNTPFTEIIEIKRNYTHPNYDYPNLYDNIALLELGRRVEYNWDKYGDSPLCIDRVGENDGENATIQGYGTTETGRSSGEFPLEANVTVISNDQCRATLAYNTTNKPNIKAKINHGLPNGLTDDMFCAQGTEKEPGVFTGACVGDSGGPLFVRREDGRKMLVGIVSGGIGCGQGYPSWYTKVSSFVPWIECIIDNSVIYKNDKGKIEEECGKIAEQAEEEYPEDYTFSGNMYGEDDNEGGFDSEYVDLEYGEYEYDI